MITYFPKPLNKQVAAISDSLTRTQKGLGIGAIGDTHDAIGSGQFVYVKNHSSLAEGLYKSKAAIAQNGALSTSNLTPDGSGGLNDLQAQVTSLSSKIYMQIVTGTLTSGYCIFQYPNGFTEDNCRIFAQHYYTRSGLSPGATITMQQTGGNIIAYVRHFAETGGLPADGTSITLLLLFVRM